MQLQEIISNLENNKGKLPRLALERAIEEKEAITPLLLDFLSNCKNFCVYCISFFPDTHLLQLQNNQLCMYKNFFLWFIKNGAEVDVVNK